MSKKQTSPYGTVRASRFPLVMFFGITGFLLLASGVHTGLIVGMARWGVEMWLRPAVPILYWLAVSGGVTLFIVRMTHRTYEKPTQQLAAAARQVAGGDFSVYIPPVHSADKLDYLDVLILDFDKMVEELGSIETLKNDFAANVSHELKTPLAAIQSYAQLLQGSGLAPGQQAYADAILGSTRRLAGLVDNMLKLNKLESQKIAPQPHPYDLCRQLCDCALGFEAVWEEKQIEFEADLEETALVMADESLLELVWNNLLSNAFKFTAPGGAVTLRQTSGAGGVTVTVADTGCGMRRETLRHIFDKFYQGDPSHATEGNGLGLALVRRILDLTDGTVTVESEPGRGSAFTVRLPAAGAGEGERQDGHV